MKLKEFKKKKQATGSEFREFIAKYNISHRRICDVGRKLYPDKPFTTSTLSNYVNDKIRLSPDTYDRIHTCTVKIIESIKDN